MEARIPFEIDGRIKYLSHEEAKARLGLPPKKLYHGTARALGFSIEHDGLDPAGCTDVPPEFRKSCYSEPGYVYFFEDALMARWFGCGAVKKVGLGPFAQTFEINTGEVKVELDPLLPRGSWRHKGRIAPNLLKSFEIFDCKKLREVI
jgi:hypothetical protein